MDERKYFCPSCGVELLKIKIRHPLWLKLYKCEREEKQYLKVMDMRHDYGIVETYPGFSEMLNALTVEEADEAWLKIRFFDHKNVSLADFERFVYLKFKSKEKYEE